jgi:5-(carboxyamino)imidazole ribonucleotide mutase
MNHSFTTRIWRGEELVNEALVGVIMGSKSDWETMQRTVEILSELKIPHEVRIVSAHRTPSWMTEYATTAEKRGIKLIIAAAGGAAHLPGMTASNTLVPVLGVPIQSEALRGLDSLLSIVQMPMGVPVGTLAIGRAGAANAALLAAAILGISHPEILMRLKGFREAQAEVVLKDSEPGLF